jgi:hypothetical protein
LCRPEDGLDDWLVEFRDPDGREQVIVVQEPPKHRAIALAWTYLEDVEDANIVGAALNILVRMTPVTGYIEHPAA